MVKKKYYDEHGNQTRSRTRKRFYQKWWMWLIVVVAVIVVITAFGGEKDITEEPVASGITEAEDEAVDEEVETTKEEEKTEAVEPEEASEESTYTYDDFKGTYALFEDEPYKSGIAELYIIENESFRYNNLWDMDLKSNITNKKIEGNILTLNFYGEENEQWGVYDESGKEQFELHYEGNKKVLHSITNGHSLYSMSNQDLQEQYDNLEIEYARIIMTINDEPSLDQWIVNNGAPVVKVRYNSAGDPTEVSNKVPYPEEVTHLDSTSQGMAAGIITYSSHGDGHITRYPMPLHYHQEDQSEEGYQQLAQESLDDADKIYVEPFDPYVVADFIGRVQFVYE